MIVSVADLHLDQFHCQHPLGLGLPQQTADGKLAAIARHR
jgi:hypothetical protein